jgi:hypothetical protein
VYFAVGKISGAGLLIRYRGAVLFGGFRSSNLV